MSDPDAAITDANPTETTTYTCSITNDDDCMVSAEVTVTIDGQIGVDERAQTNFEIHPNPSKGIVQIQLGELTDLDKIEVYTTDGKLVFSQEYQNQIENLTLDLSGLATGVYYVKLSNDEFEYHPVNKYSNWGSTEDEIYWSSYDMKFQLTNYTC